MYLFPFSGKSLLEMTFNKTLLKTLNFKILNQRKLALSSISKKR